MEDLLAALFVDIVLYYKKPLFLYNLNITLSIFNSIHLSLIHCFYLKKYSASKIAMLIPAKSANKPMLKEFFIFEIPTLE